MATSASPGSFAGAFALLRDAARQLRRAPAPTLLIALTMAIGIAPAAAIFTIGRAVVLRPLPYRSPETLVALQEYQLGQRRDQTSVAVANLERYRASRSFAAVSAFGYSEFVLSGDGDAERVIGATVDTSLLQTLGVAPVFGRGVAAGEEASGARVAVMAWSLWRRRYGMDRRILERSIVVDGEPYTVIGILPESFEFPRNASMDRDVELWVPRRPVPTMMARRGIRSLTVVARLATGASLSDAQLEATTIARRAAIDNPQINTGWGVRVLDLRDAVVGRVRPTILMLAACVAVLLVIASVNASAAVLARVTVRRQAFGVRLALGANHRQVVGTLLAETTLLAALALAIALPLSVVVRGLLIHAAPIALPRQQTIALDGLSLSFTLAVALVAGVATMVAPVSWLRRVNLTGFLGDASRTAAGSRGRSRTLGAFVVIQLALCTILLATTAEVYGGFVRRNRVDPGFNVENVMTATIPLPGMRYRDPQVRAALTGQLIDHVAALPGVEHAAVGSLLPLSGGLMSTTYQVADISPDSNNVAALRAVSAGFFQTLGIPLRRGRVIERSDDGQSPLVAVVNEALVRQTFGRRQAVGATLRVSPPGADEPQSFAIIGVVGDAKEKDLLGPATPIVYFSDRQASFPHTVLVFRSKGVAPVTAVRAALRDLDPSLALDDVSSLAAKVRSTYALQFFVLNILGAFAIAAVMLIGVGVYACMSYLVTADRRAVGVRIALGASPGRILRSALTRAAVLAAAGCTIGLVLSDVVSHLFVPAGMGSGRTALIGGAAAVAGLALAATWIPAWRASRTDPLIAFSAQ